LVIADLALPPAKFFGMEDGYEKMTGLGSYIVKKKGVSAKLTDICSPPPNGTKCEDYQ